MPNPDLSIIIPVYRTPEALLRRCIESVRELQGLAWELILVNDASPDNCPAILDEYAALDSRIQVVHRPENGRAGKARNDGLELATGEYLWFVDADDQITPEAAAVLLQFARVQQADIVLFSWCENDEQGNTLRQRHLTNAAADFSLPENRAPFFQHLYYALWNKLFRRQAVSDLRFQSFPANIGEDTLYNVAAFCRCKKLFSCSLPGYQYTMFSGSATHRGSKGMPYLETLKASQQAIHDELVKAYGDEGRHYAGWIALKRFVTGCEWIAENPDRQTRRELLSFWREYLKLLAGQLQTRRGLCGLYGFLLRILPPGKAARLMRILLHFGK